MKEKVLDAGWWKLLDEQWKKAFGEVFFHHQQEPKNDEYENLFQAKALRFAGPSAPYPNMSFELNNLSGIAGLSQLEILVITHQQIDDLTEINTLASLRSLFLFNNQIKSIDPLQELTSLEQLYLQSNKIESMLPVQKLIQLKELYVNNNCISSLEGLTEEHAENLVYFFCKPNDGIKQKEMLRVERELGIKCRTVSV